MSSPSWASLPPSISSHPSRLSQRQIGATWITQKFHWQSILYMTIHMFQGYSLNLSHSLIPLLCPQICSIFLCLECCSADRFISIIFLDFLCVCVCRCVFLSQSCLALCDHIDCTWQDSSAHGILQARILELIAIPFFRGSSWPKDQTWVFCITGRFFTVWATKEVPRFHIYVSTQNVCFSLSDLLHPVEQCPGVSTEVWVDSGMPQGQGHWI